MGKVTFEETQWKITRQTPTAASAPADGDYLPKVPESGLWFRSDKGEALFHPVPHAVMPSERQLADLPLERIHAMIEAARSKSRFV